MAKDLRSTVFKMMEQDIQKEKMEASKKESENKKEKRPKKDFPNNSKKNQEKFNKDSKGKSKKDIQEKSGKDLKGKTKKDFDKPSKQNNKISDYRDDFKVKDLEKKPKSRCPYSKKCGGCQFVDVPYDKQLKKKQQNLQELLGEFGKLEPIIGMDQPDNYRNKVHAVFGIFIKIPVAISI